MKDPGLISEAGFTLIELLIVVAIIGILIMVSLPEFANYRNKAHNSAALSDLKNFRTHMEGHLSEAGEYPVL
jgi:type IV pilus assembly protein PilA